MAAAVEHRPSFFNFLHTVLGRLHSPEFDNLIQEKKLDQELLQRLEFTLYTIQAVLNDAEQKQIQNPAVKKWLDYLKDAVDVANDLLNQVSSKPESQVEVSNLKSIIHRLESIVEHKDIFGLKEISEENLSCINPTSLLLERHVHFRDEDKQAIIKSLLDDNSDAKISVIPIMGIGGVGKTTLAQMVYTDDDLTQKFDLKAWVRVSDDFDIVKVTKSIIEAVTSSTCNVEDLNILQLHLKETLSRKKFLLVLDDLWNEDYADWDILQSPFQNAMKGSKILVTTRSSRVAFVVQTAPAYYLSPLSTEDCWSVFGKYAFHSLEFRSNSPRGKLGRKIIGKCNGLPLQAKMLGCLLRTKHDIRDWITIFESDIWDLPYSKNANLPALTICYDYLPAHLKRCFASCSLYPKDYKFNKDEVISFWMARGLLQSSNSEKNLEVGSEYFDDLVSRAFFDPFNIDGSNSFFVMHDLIHDLAISKANELRTFLPWNFTEDLSTRILSTSQETEHADQPEQKTRWIQILRFHSLTLPTISPPAILPHQWMILIRIRNLTIRLKLWRLMGFVSSVVGLSCHALSPSFSYLIGGWSSIKLFLYGVVVFIICTSNLFAEQLPLSWCDKLKAHVGFAVLMLTSMYSFWYDKAVKGKPDLMSVISNGAFALMSLSLSRMRKLGFEVGVFAFFLGCLVVQLMTINLLLILVGIIYVYLLLIIDSASD